MARTEGTHTTVASECGIDLMTATLAIEFGTDLMTYISVSMPFSTTLF